MTIPALARVSTGDPALDTILDGGIPVQSVTMLAGPPGSGKTVLALQMAFAGARTARSCLYFTTLAEPALKLLRYMQRFEFFDPELIDTQITIVDLAAVLRAGSAETLDEIAARVELHEPSLVVIDSFRAIDDLLGSASVTRNFVYELGAQMAGGGATTLLVGEYTDDEIRRLPEFGIADAVLHLRTERQGLTSVRELEVTKLRGVSYVTGRHFYEIGAGGMACYPRVRAPEIIDPPRTPERVPIGIDGLDELLGGGGVPRGSTTVLHGPTGTGKTIAAMRFLLEGARRGERVLMFTLEETPQQLRDTAANFGWNLAELEQGGHLEIVYTSPVELSPDRFLDDARRRMQGEGVQRVVIDSLTSMALGVASERRFKELVYAFTKHARAAGVTLLVTMETLELLGATTLVGYGGVSFAADNLVQLRYVESKGRLERGISVLKARGTAHATDLHALRIDANGVHVVAGFTDERGVLTDKPASERPKRR